MTKDNTELADALARVKDFPTEGMPEQIWAYNEPVTEDETYAHWTPRDAHQDDHLGCTLYIRADVAINGKAQAELEAKPTTPAGALTEYTVERIYREGFSDACTQYGIRAEWRDVTIAWDRAKDVLTSAMAKKAQTAEGEAKPAVKKCAYGHHRTTPIYPGTTQTVCVECGATELEMMEKPTVTLSMSEDEMVEIVKEKMRENHFPISDAMLQILAIDACIALLASGIIAKTGA